MTGFTQKEKEFLDMYFSDTYQPGVINWDDVQNTMSNTFEKLVSNHTVCPHTLEILDMKLFFSGYIFMSLRKTDFDTIEQYSAVQFTKNVKLHESLFLKSIHGVVSSHKNIQSLMGKSVIIQGNEFTPDLYFKEFLEKYFLITQAGPEFRHQMQNLLTEKYFTRTIIGSNERVQCGTTSNDIVPQDGGKIKATFGSYSDSATLAKIMNLISDVVYDKC